MESWELFASWASKALLGGICLYGVNILKELKDSIDELNKQVAQVIERTDWHTKELARLDIRISTLERRPHGSSKHG